MKKMFNIIAMSFLILKGDIVNSNNTPQDYLHPENITHDMISSLKLSDRNATTIKEIIAKFSSSNKSDNVRLKSLKDLRKVIKAEKNYYMDNWFKCIIGLSLLGGIQMSCLSPDINQTKEHLKLIIQNEAMAQKISTNNKIFGVIFTLLTSAYIMKYYLRSTKNNSLEEVERALDQEIETLETLEA